MGKLALLCGLTVALAAACSGSDDGDTVDAAAPADAWMPLATCTPAEAEAMFVPTCTFGRCHGLPEPESGLDLESPGSLQRAVGVESINCLGEILVVKGDPDASFLVDKLLVDVDCGQVMPPGQPLSAEEVDCIRTAIRDLP